jgi:hypothetical protein
MMSPQETDPAKDAKALVNIIGEWPFYYNLGDRQLLLQSTFIVTLSSCYNTSKRQEASLTILP